MENTEKEHAVDQWYFNEYARAVLKHGGLVPSDSHIVLVESDFQALMTEDSAYYFVPVASGDAVKWSVEHLVCLDGGGEDCALSVLDEAETLCHAIDVAAHFDLDERINSIAEGLWVLKEMKRREIVSVIEDHEQ